MSLIFLMGISGLKAQLSLTNGTPSASIDFTNNMQTSVGSNPSQPFAGSGFEANTVTAGRLNSNAWSFTGWSDGALNYGGTRTTGDYARGATAVAVTTGGVYASRVAPATAADPRMMFQPGGSDFAPGTVTLRLQNNGTTIISQLALSYNLFVRNDQGRANSFNFSWSADDITYTDVATLDYTTIEVADLLGWVQVGSSPSRSTTLTGLNFTPGSYFYIRWTCEDVSGSGSRDEIGLDDISVTATYDAPCTQPGAPQATVNSFANTNAYQTDVTFTRGVGTGGVLIVASTSATLSSDPVSGNTYTMNTNFGNGDPVGGGFVVYRGAANGASNAATITVTGLSPLTTYYFFAFEYNITVPCFKTPGNSNSVTTAAGSATLPTHYFRTVASGNWNNTSTWESSPDNATWNPATAKPTSASSGITIRNLHTVTITAPETGKLINIALGGTLTYNNTGAGGWDLDIASDGTAAHELIVNGTYLIYGIAPTLAVGATCQVAATGIIRANGNAGAGTSDDFARSTQIFLVTNAVYDWNTTSTFSSSNTIYFPNAAVGDIAIFRVSQTPSFSIGGANPTTFLGRFEANAAISFANSAVKVFRNGIIGTGNITQLAGCGQFQITGTSQLGGTGSITLNGGGMAITGTSTTTTLISNKTVDAGTFSVDAGCTLLTGNVTSYNITGTTSFVLSATANLYIGSASGITAVPTAAGNIQTSVRTFNSGANYYYYGTVNQSTGNGLPTSLTAIFEIANSGAVGNNTVTLITTNTTSTTFNLRRGLFAAGTGQQLNIIAGGTVNWQSPGGAQTTAATAGVINFNGAGTINPNTGLQLTNVTINTGAVIMGGGNTTINGIFEIKGGNVSPGTAPTYASSPASTLSYNCSCNYGAYEEWYPNTFGTSAGVPHNVNIAAGSSLNFGSGTFPHEMRGDLSISATSTFALSTGIGGDLYIKGNWTKAAGGTFTNNARAVKFNGTGSNQTITVTGGGTETFGYLQVNKGAGETVILAGAPNATNVTINGGLGGNTLELQSGDLDLNGRTINFANYFNSNQNNIGIDGTAGNLTRNIISSNGTGIFTVFNNVAGTHNITIGRISANASLLSFGSSVTLTTSGIAAGAGGINFGNTLTTINGTLQINNFGFVTGFAPTYAVNSNLVYNSTGLFDRNVEWGNASGPGYPYNVTAQNTTNLRLNFPNLNGNANRAIAGTLTIANGSTVLLSTTDPSTLAIGRDLVINGTLTMPTVAGGDVYVGRNWNRSASPVFFIHNDRAVFFQWCR
ncbi:MAG: hypothetical protein V9E88_05165 [Ferruginibacter sp.]